MDANGHWRSLMGSNKVSQDPSSPSEPRFLIIGAGSRGHGYARAIVQATSGIVAAVAEPIAFKRQDLGRKYIWHETGKPSYDQEFDDWKQFIEYETSRRKRAAAGENTPPGVDGAFVCTLDEQHAEIVRALAPLGLHIMCEKPLATTWDDCLSIYKAMRLPEDEAWQPARTKALFGIGHVLRYSPHNMLLRELLLQDRVIGDIISIEHTEPVGWWHFSHSYVRGNWRKEKTTAPSLLTKSCHDIDLLLWLLCSSSSQPHTRSALPPHLPSHVSSTGQLNYFRRSRKPAAAGSATNCLSCPIEESCMYSARKIYVDRQLKKGRTDWPVKIVNPEIEECYQTQGEEAATKMLLRTLGEDYDATKLAQDETGRRPWFGRCVWESDNDVCDDQVVTMTWEDDPLTSASKTADEAIGRWSKTAVFHMIANTEAQCERRGRIYGTTGEISYDSSTIRVFDFATGKETLHHPHVPGGGHGGGDEGLTRQFVLAVEAVKSGQASVEAAQLGFIGCSLDDVVRSHGMVFAAEEARHSRSVVDWGAWWAKNVTARLEG